MRIILAFLFVCILTVPAYARAKVLDIKDVTSTGGIKAWLVEDHSVPVIALQFSFKGIGAALDPADKQGLARMLSNTLDEGAGELDSQAFQKELRDLSINLYFSSGRDSFTGTLKTLSKNKSRAFDLMQKALTNPRFDAEPLERMRNANQGRIRRSLSNPEWVAARLLNDKAFAGHPYAQNSGGTLSSLANITADDLRSFHKHLTRDRLVVSASGDITAEELATVLDQMFGGLPETSTITQTHDLRLQNQGKIFLYKKDIPQTIIEIMQPGIDRTDPDYHIAQIMNFILGSSGFGSRLTEEIREKRGLTYGIYTYFYDLEHLDGLSVSTSTKNENVKTMIRLIKDEWLKIQEEPVTQEELKDAQSYLIGSLPLSLSSTDKIAGLMLNLQLDGLPIDYLQTREDNIRNATIENVQRVADKILNSDHFVTMLVGQPEDIENAEILDSIPNVE